MTSIRDEVVSHRRRPTPSRPPGLDHRRAASSTLLYRRLRHAVGSAGLAAAAPARPVRDEDIAALPEVVQRYLRYMHVVGRPRVSSFRVRFHGRFRLRPNGPWMPAEAWQYNSAVAPARIFVMRLRLGHVVPMVGVDTYLGGRGHMIGSMFRHTVVDGSGDEFDHSELVVYLNDAVMLAPSMLLGPATVWSAVDQRSFDVALTDRGRTVSARVFLDDRGEPQSFVADRWATLPDGLVLAPWRTPISEWASAGGLPVPNRAAVYYDLADGPFCYAVGGFDPASLAVNVDPEAL